MLRAFVERLRYTLRLLVRAVERVNLTRKALDGFAQIGAFALRNFDSISSRFERVLELRYPCRKLGG